MKTEFIEVEPKTGIRIGCGMIVAGILFTGWKAKRVTEELATYGWSQTTAEIQSAEFSSHTRSNNKGSVVTTYQGVFAYRYVVDGNEFSGSRYDAKGRMQTGLKNKSQKFKEIVRSNTPVTVYYDPSNPSNSLLKRGISEDTSVRLAFTLFLVAVGWIVVRYQLKRIKPSQI